MNRYEAPFRLNLLGPATVERDDGIQVRSLLAQPRRLALLAYLKLTRPGDYVTRDELLATFWPDADAERARNALRQGLHFLRRALRPDAVVARGDHALCVPDAVVWCDAVEFDRLLGADRHEDAFGLVRGVLLEDVPLFDVPAAEDWCAALRRRYRDRAVRAAIALCERAAAAGERASAVDWARRAVDLDACSTAATVALIESLGRAGDVVAAVRSFERFRDRLRADFDLAPSAPLVDAIERWKRGTSAGDGSGAPPAARVRLRLEVVDPASGSHVWCTDYDPACADVAAMRVDLERAVARTLEAVRAASSR